MKREQAQAIQDAIHAASADQAQTYGELTAAENRLRSGIITAALQAIHCRLTSFANGTALAAHSSMSFTLPVSRKTFARILVDADETERLSVDLISANASRSLARLQGPEGRPGLLLSETTSWRDMGAFFHAFGATYGKQTGGLPDDAYGRLLALDGGLPGTCAAVAVDGMRQSRASALVYSHRDTLQRLLLQRPEAGLAITFDGVTLTRRGSLGPLEISIGGHVLLLVDERTGRTDLHLCHVGGSPVTCRSDFSGVISADLDADLEVVAMVADRCRGVEGQRNQRPIDIFARP